ncbi:MAG: hypothetical protein HAW67_01405 [Endozoicomonadaceae bacterium]|nr:hypothetical protein [Endozoicomonadaceae bacterium]
MLKLINRTTFVDQTLIFSNEYSTNENCSLEDLTDFLNSHRDNEESLITYNGYESCELPTIIIHVDSMVIELLQGSDSPSILNQKVVRYDSEGYYVGENPERLVDNSYHYNRQYLPPVDIPYKIDWLNEKHVTLINAHMTFYENKAELLDFECHESIKMARAAGILT